MANLVSLALLQTSQERPSNYTNLLQRKLYKKFDWFGKETYNQRDH